METIRDAVRLDPEEALALLAAADDAHPQSAFREERAALRVDALVNANKIGLARDAAEDFLRRYPDSAHAVHVQTLTGVHPHPRDPRGR